MDNQEGSRIGMGHPTSPSATSSAFQGTDLSSPQGSPRATRFSREEDYFSDSGAGSALSTVKSKSGPVISFAQSVAPKKPLAVGKGSTGAASSNAGASKGKSRSSSRPAAKRSTSKTVQVGLGGFVRRGPMSEDEDEEGDTVAVEGSLTGAGDVSPEEDDEVERVDRGEELVRKRMRQRAKAKKEAERKAELQRRISRQISGPQLGTSPVLSQQPISPATAEYDDLSRQTSLEPESQALTRPRLDSVSSFATSETFSDVAPGDSSSTIHAAGLGPSQLEPRNIPMPPSATESAIRAEYLETPMSPGARSYVSTSTATGRGQYAGTGKERDPSIVRSATGKATEDDDDPDEEEEEDDEDVEYTLKDRQDAINIEHPFGLRIWKPALYKKSRSVTRNAESAVHLVPSATEQTLVFGNILWTLLFGAWLATIFVILSAMLWLMPWGGEKYGRVIFELAGYVFWPFGKYVEGFDEALPKDMRAEGDGEWDDIPEEDEEEEEEEERDVEGDGRTFGRRSGTALGKTVASQAGTIRPGEAVGLLQNGDGRNYTSFSENGKRLSSHSDATILGGGSIKSDDSRHGFRVRALGRLTYWAIFYIFVAPLMILVCGICWALVFSIPMAKLLWELVVLLANEPLALHFRSPPKFYSHRDIKEATTVGAGAKSGDGSKIIPALTPGQRAPRHSRKTYAASRAAGRFHGPNSTVLLCTYRALGLQYYKYTVDGVNIMFILLFPLVFFVIVDDWFIREYVLEHHLTGFLAALTAQGTIFILALLSVIPLSYFIGMAVASISAQSSIGMGAVINATFGSLIEIILYGIALVDGKAALVEGSIVGSLLAGVLLMPGFSMIGGAVRRKEQKFNAKSAGVTSTMLIMAIIGTLTPTLFYEIYGSFQLTCEGCPNGEEGDWSCRRCHYEHVPPADDPFYQETVRKLSWYCAILLVLSYLIGLWFSLKTHASQIWQNVQSTSENPREMTNRSSIYRRVNPADFLKNILNTNNQGSTVGQRNSQGDQQQAALPSHQRGVSQPRGGQVSVPITLPEGVTAGELSRAVEIVASTFYQPGPRQVSGQQIHHRDVSTSRAPGQQPAEEHDDGGHGGHDAPNWSRTKSASVLMGCTVLYAIIAEILVDCVDVVLEDAPIPEKFLGITLFALVPNTTEFMNAISFALNGNIALSMEIGSAYALQVCLLQIPAMLAFSAIYWAGREVPVMAHHVFTLVFPRWDMISIIFSVFLFTYVMVEARANYYRGSILVLSYLVLIGGFFWAPSNADEISYLLHSFFVDN